MIEQIITWKQFFVFSFAFTHIIFVLYNKLFNQHMYRKNWEQ